MNDLLDQIKELCAGKSAEEIEQEISESQFAERIPDAGALARYFESIAADPAEEEPAADPSEEPTDE